MSVYIDPLFSVHPDRVQNKQAKRLTAKHGQWCHMIADNQAELIDFAVRMGLRVGWIQKMGQPEEHFDLVPSRREKAVRMGAIQVSAQGLAEIIHFKKTGKPPAQVIYRAYGQTRSDQKELKLNQPTP